MNDPALPGANAALDAQSDAPPLAFSDAESAKAWAKTLPFSNVAQLHAAVAGQLRALAGAEFSARERATIAEILRDQVSYLHTELARRYAGKAQPAIDRELEAADQAIALWQSLWGQYSQCLKPLLEGDPELAGVKPKLLQRGLYVGKQLILVHGLARRAVPPEVWRELHAYYRLAEMLECAVTAVSDELMPHGVGISCYSTYSHALLLGLADPYAMRVKEIELADRWLSMWARKIFPYAQQRESEGPVLAVDIDVPQGAALVASPPASVPATMRFGYPSTLSTSVRGRLKRLQGGANPAELQLGQDCSAEQCIALLGHLDARWYQAPRRVSEAPAQNLELCAGGVAVAYFRVGGRTFDREDPLGRVYAQKTLHLQTLGAMADYDRGRDDAESNWPWEHWHGVCERRDATLTRVGVAQQRWMLDQLAVAREGDRARLGFVTRLVQDDAGGLRISMRFWAAAPKCISARPLSTAMSEDPPMPVLLLPETPEDKASLVLPPRSFSPGRVMRSIDVGPERKFRLIRLLQRGADFERVAFDESP
jgi:hypothetical protein